jgi:hypothetical protein
VAFSFSEGAYRALLVSFLGGLVVLLLTAVVPLKHVRVASNLLSLAGSLFIATQLVMIYRPAVNPVPIASPLAEEWMVGQGGHSELVNYHHVSSAQRDALDILQARDGSTHESGRRELTSYYIYGKPVLAPADGVVTFVLDGRPDQMIGSADGRYQSGNNVVIDIGGGRYLMLGHLGPGSIQVKVGEQVNVGQQIAKVGNSGNTTEPHLHIQAQTIGTGIGDVTTIDAAAILRTLHTYPLVFTNVVHTDGAMNPDLYPPTHAEATCSGQPTDTEHENATSRSRGGIKTCKVIDAVCAKLFVASSAQREHSQRRSKPVTLSP